MEDLLDHLCQLARLDLSAEEREEFKRKFADLLDFVDQVKQLGLETSEIPPQVPKERMETAPDQPCSLPPLSQALPQSYGVGHIGDLEEDGA